MSMAIDRGLRSGFPVVACYLGIFLRDHWDQITSRPWWSPYSPDIKDRLEVDRDLLRELDLDWIQCSLCRSRPWREGHRLRSAGSRAFLVNTQDGTEEELVRPPIGGRHIRMLPGSIIQNPLQVEDAIPVKDASELRHEGRMDYVELLRKGPGSDRFLVAALGTPYWRALSQFFGFRMMLLNLRRNPGLVERVLDRIVEEQVELIKAYAWAGVDGIWLEECLSSAAEISPADFKRFVCRYNRQLVDQMHGEGIRCIYYPCGDVLDRIEPIIETGADCISLEESKKDFEIDISRVDEEVSGRTCIFGNLSAIGILARGTTRELRAAIRRQIEVGRRHGRFVMSLGSPVTPGTSIDRVKEYVRISREESAGPSGVDDPGA
jgi:uroporphyrinogen-III decarboxylase